jgi:hypothetical protein
MPDFRLYAPVGTAGVIMLRRWVLIFSVVVTGLVLSGCTKCGPIWDDWTQSPKSCKSDHF